MHCIFIRFYVHVSFKSFVATSPNGRDGVKLKRKFSDWDFSWYDSLNNRMPWVVASGSAKKKALLTTSSSATYYPSGSILWEGNDRNPADWIDRKRDPGVIWYWVNEDDCDADRKPGAMNDTVGIIVVVIIIIVII